MRYIKEVQGLRTVAAMMVAVYHIWFNRVSGGVDVFFVVAAFFMTRTLLKIGQADEAGQTKARTGVKDYYAKTARRVFPNAAIVLIVTIIAGILILPKGQWLDQWTNAVSSSLFVENWWLIQQAQDYMASEAEPTPFQQFWALALQVQFYVVFPLLLLIAVFIARKMSRTSVHKVLLVIFGLVTVASFAYSVWFTALDQPASYFSTLSRAWEFGIGGLLALSLTKERGTGSTLWRVVGWFALAVLISFAAIFNVSSHFPGFAALVPVGAATLLIIAAYLVDEPRILRWRLLLWLAPASFAFYLWHWPILVFYRTITERSPGIIAGTGIIVLSWILAIGSTRLIEDPIRQSKRLAKSVPMTALVCVLLMVPTWAGAAYWMVAYDNATIQIEGRDPLRPNPAGVKAREKALYKFDCDQGTRKAEVIICEYGDLTSQRTVVISGGSHTSQWVGVLDKLGQRNDFKLIQITRSACTLEYTPEPTEQLDLCQQWQNDAVNEIIKIKPNVVVTTVTKSNSVRPDQVLPGAVHAWKELAKHDIPILGLRDNPRLDFDPVTCIENNSDNLEVCTNEYSTRYRPKLDMSDFVSPNNKFVDWSTIYCPDGRCNILDDSIFMYYDYHHFTETWLQEKMYQNMQDALLPFLNQHS